MMSLAESNAVGRASRQEVDQWIDTLDRGEPERSGWRTAFDRLKATLTGARNIRRIVRYPLGALLVAVQAAYLLARAATGPFDRLSDWIGAVGIALLVVLLIWEIYVRHTYPVLQMEGRVVALLRYYGSTDLPTEQESY